MKFLLLLFLTFRVMADIGPVARSVTHDGTNVVVPGSVEKWHINVYNNSGIGLTEGTVVIADNASANGYSVVTTTTRGKTPLCVIDDVDDNCTSYAICRCQTWGLNEEFNFDSTDAGSSKDGPIYLSETTAGYGQAESQAYISADDYRLGVFYEASSSSDVNASVFIRLRQ